MALLLDAANLDCQKLRSRQLPGAEKLLNNAA